MNTHVPLLAITLSLVATSALAQTPTDQSSMKGADMFKPDAAKMNNKFDSMKMDQKSDSAAMSEGEVRKINKDQGKLTLKHGEIKNLGMPGMTMIFLAQDKAMLDHVKEGDKVKFVAENINNQLTVTKIELAK